MKTLTTTASIILALALVPGLAAGQPRPDRVPEIPALGNDSVQKSDVIDFIFEDNLQAADQQLGRMFTQAGGKLTVQIFHSDLKENIRWTAALQKATAQIRAKNTYLKHTDNLSLLLARAVEEGPYVHLAQALIAAGADVNACRRDYSILKDYGLEGNASQFALTIKDVAEIMYGESSEIAQLLTQEAAKHAGFASAGDVQGKRFANRQAARAYLIANHPDHTGVSVKDMTPQERAKLEAAQREAK